MVLKGEEVEVVGRVCGDGGLIYTLTEHITGVITCGFYWRLNCSCLIPCI